MDNFSYTRYYSKKKFFKLFGGEIRIYDENRSRLLFFIKQKAFKLKEDITIFSNESMSEELLKIQARQIIDFSAAYDVTDVKTSERIGAIRRKGFKSILRDHWEIINASDNVIGRIEEESMFKAVLRRFLTNLIPQSFQIFIGEKQVGILKQTFNPFVPQFIVDYNMDTNNSLDRRIGIAIVVLLQIVEGRQNAY